MTLFYLLFAFQLKHFIVDFPLQTPYQWKNKGKWGHPGGLIHSGLHALATFTILILFTDQNLLSLYLALADGFIHYHIDWAKMRLNDRFNLSPEWDKEFWWLLGFDQFLHQVTYIGIIVALYLNLN